MQKNDWTGTFHSGPDLGSENLQRQYIGGTTQGTTGIALADGLISGIRWDGLTITYNFPVLASQYGSTAVYGDNAPASGFLQFTPDMQTDVTGIFNTISSFTNANFAQIADTAPGSTVDIAFGQTSATGTGFAYSPGSSAVAGDVWLANGQFNNPGVGNYEYLTFMHEIGHALGLKHSHEADGIAGAVQSGRDSMEFTVMSYRSYVGDVISGGYSNETNGFAQSYMMLDIAALQAMYGADYTANAGNSVYTFNAATGAMLINGITQVDPEETKIFRTIWDGDGVDTFDFSTYANNQDISLAAGRWSMFSAAQLANLGDGNTARANVYNALLFNDDTRSLIENATAGIGNDHVEGNQIANTLIGNAGADILVGQGGNDTLNGGIGDDMLYGDFEPVAAPPTPSPPPYAIGTGYTTLASATVRNTSATAFNLTNNFSVSADAEIANATTVAHSTVNATANGGADWYKVTLNAGNRLIIDIDNTATAFDSYVYVVSSNGTTILGQNDDGASSPLDNGSTNPTDSQLIVNALTTGVYYIVVDTYRSGQTLATANIATGTTYELNVSVDITPPVSDLAGPLGIAGIDILNGGDGNDTLDGGAGGDTLNGGAGDDIYITDTNLDIINEVVGQGTDTVRSTVSFTQLDAAGALENLTYVGNSTGILYGNNANNILTGGAMSDSLNGFGGVDIYYGMAGDDYLFVDHQDFYNGGDGWDALYLQTITGTTVDLSLSQVEFVVGYTGNDTLNGSTSTVAVTLIGGAGADVLRGGSANDFLYIDGADSLIDAGGGNNDVIVVADEAGVTLNITAARAEYVIGDSGNDVLNATGSTLSVAIQGRAGADTITGGNMNDYLYGGTGADIFRVTANAQFDAILDFVDAGGAEDDRIDVRSLGANFDTLAEVLAATSDNSGTSVINFGGGNQLYLYQIAKTSLTADDFIF
jgi:serralysin